MEQIQNVMEALKKAQSTLCRGNIVTHITEGGQWVIREINGNCVTLDSLECEKVEENLTIRQTMKTYLEWLVLIYY